MVPPFLCLWKDVAVKCVYVTPVAQSVMLTSILTAWTDSTDEGIIRRAC